MLQEKEERWLTRERAQALAFTAIAATLAFLCWLIVEPLLGAVTWAFALAVVAHPLHAWLLRRLEWKSFAAALVTLLVAIALVVPATLTGRQVAREAVAAATKVQNIVKDGSLREFVDRNPRAAAAYAWLSDVVDLQEQLGRLSEHVPKAVQKFVSGSLQFAVGVAVAFFLLFFFLRDRAQMLDALRRLLPLSADEAAQVFRRVDHTVYAIIYGTLAVSLVQGTLGALMFWWLGLPAPLLWGSAMAVMAIVPVVGTAIIWGPAAVFLLLEGSPEKALILTAWGALVIGLIDNLLKPAIVKDRLHVHIVPVFISLLGGLLAFGAEGVIIGPVILAIVLALIDIWRQRAAGGETRQA